MDAVASSKQKAKEERLTRLLLGDDVDALFQDDSKSSDNSIIQPDTLDTDTDHTPLPTLSPIHQWSGEASLSMFGTLSELRALDDTARSLVGISMSAKGMGDDFVAIICGSDHFIAISRMGVAFACGNNKQGACGLGNEISFATSPMLIAFDGLGPKVKVSTAACSDHTLFVSDVGEMWGCGANAYGQLGLNHRSNVFRPTRVLIDNVAPIKLVKVAAALRHSVALTENGDVYTWGEERFGKLGYMTEHAQTGDVTPNTETTSSRNVLESLGAGACSVAPRLVNIVSPSTLSPSLTSSTPVWWSHGSGSREKIVHITAGTHFTALLTELGIVLTMGRSLSDPTVLREDATDEEWIEVNTPPAESSASQLAALFANVDGAGSNVESDAVSAVSKPTVTAAAVPTPAVASALSPPGVTRDLTGGLSPSTSEWELIDGERKDTDNTPRKLSRTPSPSTPPAGVLWNVVPTAVMGLIESKTVIRTIAAGQHHLLALSKSGRLCAWGLNWRGQCGVGSKDHVAAPYFLKKFKSAKIRSIAASAWHSLAIDDRGVLYVWGCDNTGQRGMRNNQEQLTPIAQPALRHSKVVFVSCGPSMTAAISVALSDNESVITPTAAGSSSSTPLASNHGASGLTPTSDVNTTPTPTRRRRNSKLERMGMAGLEGLVPTGVTNADEDKSSFPPSASTEVSDHVTQQLQLQSQSRNRSMLFVALVVILLPVVVALLVRQFTKR